MRLWPSGISDSPPAWRSRLAQRPGGGAILTDCILCLVDWQTGNTPYRHPAYREANLSLSPNECPDLPWAVRRGSDAIACFADIGKAAAYLAFMRGATIEPRVFA